MGMSGNQLMLVKYVIENNFEKARIYAEACCKEDLTQKNSGTIKRLMNLYSGLPCKVELPANISTFSSLEKFNDSRLEHRYYLSPSESKVYEDIKGMSKVSLFLMERGIPYLNATLLYGESGVGKTEFSKYVASRLGLDYLYVNLSVMLDSYLGGTAKNLSNLFRFISTTKCLVMLDEIDCIAIKRKYNNEGSSSEVARSTTCLLQLLDRVSNDTIIMAATNMKDYIDSAVLRRFTTKHEMLRLSTEGNIEMMSKYLDDVGLMYDLDSLVEYASNDNTQSSVISHMVYCIARAVKVDAEHITF